MKLYKIYSQKKESMVRIYFILTICMICALTYHSSISYAETIPTHVPKIGAEIEYIKYEEPDIMENTGIMYGITGSYAYHNNIMLKADGRFSYGQVDYSSAETGDMDNIDDYIFEVRGAGGYDISSLKDVVITPYFGFGYRYLNDESGVVHRGSF